MTTYTDRQKACGEVAVALEQQRALHIVAAVRKQGFAKSANEIPTQAEAAFDLACEEIEHRLRTEVWELNGVASPITAFSEPAGAGDVRGEAIYQQRDHEHAHIWHDTTKRTYVGLIPELRRIVYLAPSQPAAPAEQSPLMTWQDGVGLLWDVYGHGKWIKRVVSPLKWDAHAVYLDMQGARYAPHIDVRLVSSANNSSLAAPAVDAVRDERSTWSALADGAAAELEIAAVNITEPDAKKAAKGAADFVRKRVKELWQARASDAQACPHDDPQAWSRGLPPRTPMQREFEAAMGRAVLNEFGEYSLSREHQTGGYTFKGAIAAFKAFVATVRPSDAQATAAHAGASYQDGLRAAFEICKALPYSTPGVCAKRIESLLAAPTPSATAPAALTDDMAREHKRRIAQIVHTDCTLIPGATFYNAAEMAIDATLAQLKPLVTNPSNSAETNKAAPKPRYSEPRRVGSNGYCVGCDCWDSGIDECQWAHDNQSTASRPSNSADGEAS